MQVIAFIQGVHDSGVAIISVEISKEAIAAVICVDAPHYRIHTWEEANARRSFDPSRRRRARRSGVGRRRLSILHPESFYNQVLRSAPGSRVGAGPTRLSNSNRGISRRIAANIRTSSRIAGINHREIAPGIGYAADANWLGARGMCDELEIFVISCGAASGRVLVVDAYRRTRCKRRPRNRLDCLVSLRGPYVVRCGRKSWINRAVDRHG